MSDCIFCKIAKGDIPSVKVYESDSVIAFLDVNPMEKGHTLVVPKRHWKDLASVSVADGADLAVWEELAYLVRVVTKAALKCGATGVNILQCTGESAGQTVGHLHFHVIPRYSDGAAQPKFESGAFKYADDAQRDKVASELRKATADILGGEDLL